MAPKTSKSPKSKKSAPIFTSNNFLADFSISKYDKDVQIMAAILAKSDLNVYFSCSSDNTPFRFITKAYSTADYDKETDTLSFLIVDGKTTGTISRDSFVSALGGHQNIPELPPVYEPLPTNAELSSFLEEIGHEDSPPNMGDIKKAKFPAPWHMGVHFVLRCLSGKTGGTDAIVKDLLRLLWGVYYDRNIDFGGILWNDFKQYVLAKKTKVHLARFWSVVFKIVYSKHPTILPADDDVMFRSKHPTNLKCPPSIRRLPNNLLRLAGITRKAVKNYILVGPNLLPALADVGAALLVAAAETHASEGEEETDSRPLFRRSHEQSSSPPQNTKTW